MEDKEIKVFNENVKDMLEQIIAKGIANKCIKNYETLKICKLCWEDDKENIVSERYLDYYWIEFAYGPTIYKISMFYKDFDMNTGNIHVLPGAIQIWKKDNDDGMWEDFLCIRSKYIKPSPECGWFHYAISLYSGIFILKNMII